MKPSLQVKDRLVPILANRYSEKELRDLVQVSYVLALPLIRKKIAVGKLNLDVMGMREPDIVYDCLAELFQRDSRGRLYQVARYFEHQNVVLDATSDEEVLRLYRILIFSHVQKNIIRLYQEADPVLGKIIRNIKEFVATGSSFGLLERFGETALFATPGDILLERPLFSTEDLKELFFAHVRGNASIPAILKRLHDALTQQDARQRVVLLTPLALLVKEFYALDHALEGTVDQAVGRHIDEEVVTQVLDRVCDGLTKESYDRYVTREKKDQQIVAHYMHAVRGILDDTLFKDEREPSSYFDHLRGAMPHLTREEYARDHRSALEYIAKLGKERVKEQLGRLFSAT